MARFKRSRRYRSYAGRARSRGGRVGGKFGGILPPLIGGAADGVIGTPWGIDGIGSAAIGYVMKSTTTRDIGLNRIGRTLAQKFMGGGIFGFSPGGGAGGDGGLY